MQVIVNTVPLNLEDRCFFVDLPRLEMDVKFREANNEDRDQVKEVSKGIYNNSDTLLCCFPTWLKSYKWFLFVGEVCEGKIIAFTAVQVTDGMEGLTIRNARVHEKYRGNGIFRAIVRYAVQYVRESFPDAKFVYRSQIANVRVPDGYEVIKETELWAIILDNNKTTEQSGECKLTQSSVRILTWTELKELYEKKDNVKCMFDSELLEIGGEIFPLNCDGIWKHLEERVNTHVMLSEDECTDGKVETGVSLLGLEKLVTNEGIPVVSMNTYGLKNDALLCHVSEGLLKSSAYVGGGKYIFKLFGERGFSKFMSSLTEFSGCRVVECVQLNLLRGDLSKKLEDV